MSFTTKEYFVKDLVIDDEYATIDSESKVIDAAKKMKELGIPDLVVVEKKTEKVLGVVADFDIVQKIVAEGKDPKTESVKTAMYIITPVNLETNVKEAFARMRDLKVDIVPVLEDGKLVGVCSIQDCWSYIPDKKEERDMKGFIAIKDTKIAEFWFGTICAIIAFVLGILLPLIGTIGYFSSDTANLTNLLGVPSARGGRVSFYLFDARGGDFIISYFDLATKNGWVWVMIALFSYFIIILGIISLFLIIYTAISDARNVEIKSLYRVNIPLIFVACLIFQWILFSGAFSQLTPPDFVMVDIPGLIFSIISMVLMVAAVFRDYMFREEELPGSTKEG